MFNLARRLARSSFGIGAAIGVLIAPSVAVSQPVLTPIGEVDELIPEPIPMVCPEAASLPDPSGPDAVTWCSYVSFARGLHRQVVGGQNDAPLAYRAWSPIPGMGLYSITDADGTPMSVKVLATASVEPAIPLGADGSAAIIWAELTGPKGSAAVEAFMWTQVIDNGALVTHIKPWEYLAPEVATNLAAGPGFNTAAMTASQFANCLAQAAAAYAATYAIFAARYALCMKAASAGYKAALRLCARFILMPKLALACAAVATVGYAIARSRCQDGMRDAHFAAAAAAAAAFAACMAGAAVPVAAQATIAEEVR